jgi:hypothetical protein
LFWGHRQNTRFSRNSFVKKIFVCISHHDNVLARCDSIFPLLRECGTKRAHNFLFPKSSFRIWRTTVLGMFKDSWCDSMVKKRNFQQLSRNYTTTQKPVYMPMFTSVWVDFGLPPLIIFHQLPSVSKSRVPPKNVWSVQSLIPISLLHQY